MLREWMPFAESSKSGESALYGSTEEPQREPARTLMGENQQRHFQPLILRQSCSRSKVPVNLIPAHLHDCTADVAPESFVSDNVKHFLSVFQDHRYMLHTDGLSSIRHSGAAVAAVLAQVYSYSPGWLSTLGTFATISGEVGCRSRLRAEARMRASSATNYWTRHTSC
jgi:hypothetical protein